MTTTVPASTFNQDTASIKRAVDAGETVIVTDRGRPALVVLPVAEYERLTGRGAVLGPRLRSERAAEIDLPAFPRAAWVSRSTGL